MPEERAEQLLTPSEVAARFRVDPKTVTRWANAGKISSIRTLGGHRRFRRAEVEDLLVASGLTAGDGGQAVVAGGAATNGGPAAPDVAHRDSAS
ncbi:BldC family transcriptional regulator [Georgenia sp. TF02-10]|uniref:BldC family transcriptional regulator n=1 Tax=Georgenia sp. TF02-10 TaxID=2917725 RepID=UPI001FA71DBF|nr:BldC family transcriptional regulator [Georgenia sp. TF02-10]UNX54550.1 BldC family transcriptional regulator [Georgenia sp. TF02-10]